MLLRLVRWKNLSIIVLTFFSVWFYYRTFADFSFFSGFEFFNFILLIFSTVCIAAGGNIINDCFDIEADKINKPEKLIINRYISLNNAKLIYVNLNFIGFLIGCYLSMYYHTFWFGTINSLTIALLWNYSYSLKKISIIGNMLVSLLVAFIPIMIVLFFEFSFNQNFQNTNLILNSKGLIFDQFFQFFFINSGVYSFVVFYFLFAFILNTAREIVKDGQDLEGDKKINSHSLAIILGDEKLKLILMGILNATFVLLLLIFFRLLLKGNETSILLYFPILAMMLLLVTIIFRLRKNKKDFFSRTSLYLKIMLLIGLCYPFWSWFVV